MVFRLNLTKEEAEGGIILDGETKIEPSPWCAAQIAQSVGSGCNGTLEYRDPLGRCNNINHQQWGSAFERYRRILLPQFDDGTPQEHCLPKFLTLIHKI